MIKDIMSHSPKFFEWILTLNFGNWIIIIFASIVFLNIIPSIITGKTNIFAKLIYAISQHYQKNNRIRLLRSQAYQDLLSSAIYRAVSMSRNITEQYSYKVKQIEDGTLRHQMNYAEIELETALSELSKGCESALEKKLESWHPCECKDGNGPCVVGLNIKNINLDLYKKALDQISILLRDIIRRACKENGFDKMKDSEFKDYTKLKVADCQNTLESASESRVREYSIIVKHSQIWELSDTTSILCHFTNIFNQAKRCASDTKKRVEKINGVVAKELAKISIDEQMQILSFNNNTTKTDTKKTNVVK